MRLPTLALALLSFLPWSARAQEPDDDGVHVVLCFSGGGTRAAAFALGATRGLAEVDAGGAPLLERVDRVVGVSGGSLTAAQVAIDRSPEALLRFEREVLRDDMELAMVKAAAADGFSLLFRDLTRCDVAASCFDQRMLGTSFAALPARPELWIQTTDVRERRPLVLSRASLEALGLDPAQVPVARALAASAAFPGVFPPLRLEVGGEGKALVLPAAGAETRTQRPTRPGAQPERALAEPRSASRPPPLYLADGGILDNLGLEPALEAPLPPGTRAVVYLVVNARGSLLIDDDALGSSIRSGVHALSLQQRRMDDLHFSRARDRLRLLELEARLAGRALSTRLVVIDFAGSSRQDQLDPIGTRFALDEDEVGLLLAEGQAIGRARAAAAAEVWPVAR